MAHLGAGELAFARGERSNAAHHLSEAFTAAERLSLGRFLPRIEQLIGLMRAQTDTPVTVGNA
jgi:hypothetical protein